MDKEIAKRIINELIDSADEITELQVLDDTEETDMSTLDEERIIRRNTGYSKIMITTYKEP